MPYSTKMKGKNRANSRFAPSQWETVELCKRCLPFAGRKSRISPEEHTCLTQESSVWRVWNQVMLIYESLHQVIMHQLHFSVIVQSIFIFSPWMRIRFSQTIQRTTIYFNIFYGTMTSWYDMLVHNLENTTSAKYETANIINKYHYQPAITLLLMEFTETCELS